MKEKIRKLVSTKWVILSIYILLAIVASIQSQIGTKNYKDETKESNILIGDDEREYNRYNNYTIFEKSFEHLINNKDLYINYPEEHWDLYKYTPSFSVFFGIFNILPDWLGLSLWNLLNVLVLAFSIYYLPRLTPYQKGIILLIIIIELVTSIQSEQSNALITGLLLFTFGFLERNKTLWATLMIAMSIFIKPFGLVGYALFLFYPNKLKSALYSLFWISILISLPLIFVDWDRFVEVYIGYIDIINRDNDGVTYGYSVMGILNTWLSTEINKNIVVAIGVFVFLLPFYRIKMYGEFIFKYLLVCSILIWIVIFNHRAESPTFIIAMTGVAMWFVKSEKNRLNILLFVFAFILTSLSPTDIFPRYLRDEFVKPYNLKALPCILIWIKIIYDMINLKKEEYLIEN